MGTIRFEVLHRGKVPSMAEIDRSETIDHIYYLRDGNLVLEGEHWDVPPWSPEKVDRFVREHETLLDRGGAAFGAFDVDRLVAMASVDGRFIGDPPDQLNMAFLHVSSGYRGRGIGSRLLEMAKTRAHELGARRLYVSAVPSRATVDFYMRRGFHIAQEVDPELFEREPEDIHMELVLWGDGG
jgi:GNAT superfamily N-acetyltransferase